MEDVITGLEFLVDLPIDPSWVSRMKQKIKRTLNITFSSSLGLRVRDGADSAQSRLGLGDDHPVSGCPLHHLLGVYGASGLNLPQIEPVFKAANSQFHFFPVQLLLLEHAYSNSLGMT